jgi:hypothetical protein
MSNVFDSIKRDILNMTYSSPVTATKNPPQLYTPFIIDTLDDELVFKVSIRTKLDQYNNKIITIKLKDEAANLSFKKEFDKDNTDTFNWIKESLIHYDGTADWLSALINKNILDYLKGNWISGKFIVSVNRLVANNMSHAEALYSAITGPDSYNHSKYSYARRMGQII